MKPGLQVGCACGISATFDGESTRVFEHESPNKRCNDQEPCVARRLIDDMKDKAKAVFEYRSEPSSGFR